MPKGGKRTGAGRPPGIPNPNAGRPGTWFRAEKGQALIHERETIGGQKFYKPELWTVLSVSEREIEFQCGNDIIVVRWPEEDD